MIPFAVIVLDVLRHRATKMPLPRSESRRRSRFSSIKYAIASRSRRSNQPISTPNIICNAARSIATRSIYHRSAKDVGPLVEQYGPPEVVVRKDRLSRLGLLQSGAEEYGRSEFKPSG